MSGGPLEFGVLMLVAKVAHDWLLRRIEERAEAGYWAEFEGLYWAAFEEPVIVTPAPKPARPAAPSPKATAAEARARARGLYLDQFYRGVDDLIRQTIEEGLERYRPERVDVFTLTGVEQIGIMVRMKNRATFEARIARPFMADPVAVRFKLTEDLRAVVNALEVEILSSGILSTVPPPTPRPRASALPTSPR